MGARETAEIDAALPSVTAYVRGLPAGWSSYPECAARGRLLGSLAVTGALDGLEGLPDALARHLPTLSAGWIPEVVHVGLMLAVRDRRFAGAGGEDAFLAWLHRLNGAVMPERSDPRAAVLELPTIWSSLHTGTVLEVREASESSALLAARHPEPLFPALASRWRCDAIAGLLVRSGAVQPRVTQHPYAGGETLLAITWT